MSQHLNRLNDKEANEFDVAFDKFCKAENQENEMKVYLVEVQIVGDGILEPIAIKTNWELAHYLVNGKNGRITEMTVDKEYPDGTQMCLHWNFYEKNNRSVRVDANE